LCIFPYKTLSIIQTLDSSNYIDLIKSESKNLQNHILVACVEGRIPSTTVSFLISYTDLAGKHKNYSSFIYCNSLDSGSFLEAVDVQQLPALIMIYRGIAYHYYNATAFTDIKSVSKFLYKYKEMSQRITIVPDYMLSDETSLKLLRKNRKNPLEEILEEGLPNYIQRQFANIMGREHDYFILGAIFCIIPLIFALSFMLFGIKFEDSHTQKADSKKEENKQDLKKKNE